MLNLKLEDSRLLLYVGLISKTYILFSFLYWVKAPGGMILMRFCSKRLKTTTTKKGIYMLNAQMSDRNYIKNYNFFFFFLYKYKAIYRGLYVKEIFLLKGTK